MRRQLPALLACIAVLFATPFLLQLWWGEQERTNPYAVMLSPFYDNLGYLFVPAIGLALVGLLWLALTKGR